MRTTLTIEPENPYYNPEFFALKMLEFEEPGLSYEYNTLLFFATDDGQVYTVRDSGCSCPIPFEQYAAATQPELLAKMERVGSLEQARRTLEAFISGWCFDVKYTDQDTDRKLSRWFADNFKQ